MKVLALDFDGVISDSAAEAFVVAMQTYAELCPSSRLAAGADELPSGGYAKIQANQIYPAFVELMPLGNRAEDYAVALRLIDRDTAVVDQAEYDEHRQAQGARFLEDFHHLFYQRRRALLEADEGAWLALLRPYSDFVEVLRRRADDAVLALATAKDRNSVEVLLRTYGIADLFPSERILDKEAGVSKRAHLSVLRQRLSVAFADITFVDDKVNHLQSVASLGVRCALAAWGYNARREHEIARSLGYPVCNLMDAERRIFGPA